MGPLDLLSQENLPQNTVHPLTDKSLDLPNQANLVIQHGQPFNRWVSSKRTWETKTEWMRGNNPAREHTLLENVLAHWGGHSTTTNPQVKI